MTAAVAAQRTTAVSCGNRMTRTATGRIMRVCGRVSPVPHLKAQENSRGLIMVQIDYTPNCRRLITIDSVLLPLALIHLSKKPSIS